MWIRHSLGLISIKFIIKKSHVSKLKTDKLNVWFLYKNDLRISIVGKIKII